MVVTWFGDWIWLPSPHSTMPASSTNLLVLPLLAAGFAASFSQEQTRMILTGVGAHTLRSSLMDPSCLDFFTMGVSHFSSL
jgi:hypothetical protein